MTTRADPPYSGYGGSALSLTCAVERVYGQAMGKPNLISGAVVAVQGAVEACVEGRIGEQEAARRVGVALGGVSAARRQEVLNTAVAPYISARTGWRVAAKQFLLRIGAVLPAAPTGTGERGLGLSVLGDLPAGPGADQPNG